MVFKAMQMANQEEHAVAVRAWRVRIIKSLLLWRDVSADKVNQPADLFMLVLDELK